MSESHKIASREEKTMSKLKRKVYSASLRLGWAFYKWSLDKYWEEEDKKWNPK